MLCKQCGKELDPGERVCSQCGKTVEEAAPGVAPLEQVRSGPIFLAALICLSVSKLFELFNAFGGGGLISLVGVAISGVMLAGLWLVWSSGLAGKAHLMDTGLRLLQGATLVQLILTAVVFGIGGLAALVMVVVGGADGLANFMSRFAYDSNNFYDVLGVGLLLVCLIVVAVSVAMILYSLFIWRDVKMVRASQAAGRLQRKPSLYVAVVTFISAAIELVMLVAGGGNVIWFLTGIGAQVLFGLVILQLREQADN